jgi:hypothetical protein
MGFKSIKARLPGSSESGSLDGYRVAASRVPCQLSRYRGQLSGSLESCYLDRCGSAAAGVRASSPGMGSEMMEARLPGS